MANDYAKHCNKHMIIMPQQNLFACPPQL